MTSEAYFNELPEKRKAVMLTLHKAITEVLPGVELGMHYKLPTYSIKNFRICAIASQNNYMALYIMNYDLLVHFEKELNYFNCGKSCIRFNILDLKTLNLLKKILIFINENINESRFYKK